MSDEFELSPCPFCGSEAVLISDYGDYPYKVACKYCGCFVATPLCATKQEAISIWNNREGCEKDG